jgi:hypothetical protein
VKLRLFDFSASFKTVSYCKRDELAKIMTLKRLNPRCRSLLERSSAWREGQTAKGRLCLFVAIDREVSSCPVQWQSAFLLQ